MASSTMAAKDHVADIRRTKFSIGGEPNPLTEDLHQAVKNLSAELYAKDVHFLMELIQNAEDNEYPEGVDPSLEFVITSNDITNTGAPATLLVFNNEIGFSRKNIDSVCSVGRSTKKGLRKCGYIGEKGIGFKSVFLITSQPYIFSNGYQIKFNEKPCSQCNVGYIVPEWVMENKILSAIKNAYGLTTTSPTTTLVLPLKPDKVKSVKDQLSSIHPEVLLFLSKIKRLSVREENEDSNVNTVSAISISSDKDFVTSKSINADSYTIYLTADETGEEGNNECGYYMWKQRFPVKKENKVEVRSEVEEWVITLAFPIGTRLKRGNVPGIYAFLPTETVTNFPFIIQADFLLASSRENILWDSKWNQGILSCVSVAFLNAFISLVKSTENAPVSNLPHLFRFLPVKFSTHERLNIVRGEIRLRLISEAIIPCESYTSQKLFCKPKEVGRLKPEFWSILKKAKTQGVNLHNISSHGAYLLNSSFDQEQYDDILDYLLIEPVDVSWYAKCIAGTNLVMGVDESVYIKLLVFIANNWMSLYYNTDIKNVPILKYVGLYGNVNLYKINECANKLVTVDLDSDRVSWLINWNTEFLSSRSQFLLPKHTQELIGLSLDELTLKKWLKEDVEVKFVNVYEYAVNLSSLVENDSKMAVTYAHFLHSSLEKKYLNQQEIEKLCKNLPIVDNYGQVTRKRDGVLVPAYGSKWVELIGSNPWRKHNYVELGEDYVREMNFFGIVKSGEDILSFLKTYIKASDVPDISPPNASIPTLSSPLTKINTMILLLWLYNLKRKKVDLPEIFLSSIKSGSWLKITLSGSPGYRSPSESFMLESSSGSILQNGSVLVDIPLVDENYYGDEIKIFKEELKTIGVRFENKDACEYIGRHLMYLAVSSKLTSENVISILKFIRYLGEHYISSKEFIERIKIVSWVRTCKGDMFPKKCVLFGSEWNAALQISDIPFIDEDYYGKDILLFKKELKLLGVVVKFDLTCYQIVLDNLKVSSLLNSLSSEAMLLVLTCVQKLDFPAKIVRAVKNTKCLKTNLGYRYPHECFLVDSRIEWGCLLYVFASFPILDENFYGNWIFSMEKELKILGVKVDFEDAAMEFTRAFKQHASTSLIRKENVFLLLECLRKLKRMTVKFPKEVKNCIRNEKWLKTKIGDYRSPNECILFGADWVPISQIAILPFIDDSDNAYGSRIHEYKVELKRLGVISITEFKDGANFVVDRLMLPESSSSITPASFYALMDSVKTLKESSFEILDKLVEKLSKKSWLRTYNGYKCPDECLYYYPAWDPYLKHDDGLFIDSRFYGSRIRSYKDELNLLGVVTDIKDGCKLIASNLDSESNFDRINRFYSYLSEFKWESDDEDDKRIWIPRGSDNGEFVTPQDCVLHDKHNLFGGQLNVLDKLKYDTKVVGFFADTFNVKVHPCVEDYCSLWKKWETSGNQLTVTECCSFWEFVVKNWNSKTHETFIKSLSKLPVSLPDSDGIFLSDKRDVFIGDDLFLTELFQSSKSLTRTIFVWFPIQSSSKNLTRIKLEEIYNKLGVRILSRSVRKTLSDVDIVTFKPVDSKQNIIKKGLIKLILGFLADPNLKRDMERRERHKAVNRILGVKAFETVEPMTVKYSLSLSCGDVVNVEAKRMIRWDKQESRLFMRKLERRCCGYKNIIEYASHFGEVIAEGVLWEHEEVVPQLAELIRLGFLVEFDDEAVDFLMKTKNLQIFIEDYDYLSSIFPC